MAKQTTQLTAYKAGVRAAKNPRKGRGRGGFKLPPLAIIGGLVPAGVDILAAFKFGGFQCALEHVSLCTTGYDPYDGQWKPGFAAQKLYGPLFLGTIVHKVANGLGVNRMLAAAGLRFLRI